MIVNLEVNACFTKVYKNPLGPKRRVHLAYADLFGAKVRKIELNTEHFRVTTNIF